MIVFVAELAPESKIVWIGYALDSEDVYNQLEFANFRTGADSLLLDEYAEDFEDQSTTLLKAYIDLMSVKLRYNGYAVVDTIDSYKNFYRLYVIRADDPSSNILYVGQTSYPIEVRFLQHKYNGHSNKGYEMSARMFRSGSYTAHSLEYDLILDKNVYKYKHDAEVAEAELGIALRDKGYNVHWA